MKSTAEQYTAKVYGITWAGYAASTKYTFYRQPTRAEVMAKAGDFQSVTRIYLTRMVTTVESSNFGQAPEIISVVNQRNI